jgi:hypothetical protein
MGTQSTQIPLEIGVNEPTADTTIGPTISAATLTHVLEEAFNSLHTTISSKTDTRRPVSSEARLHSQANPHRTL